MKYLKKYNETRITSKVFQDELKGVIEDLISFGKTNGDNTFLELKIKGSDLSVYI